MAPWYRASFTLSALIRIGYWMNVYAHVAVAQHALKDSVLPGEFPSIFSKKIDLIE